MNLFDIVRCVPPQEHSEERTYQVYIYGCQSHCFTSFPKKRNIQTIHEPSLPFGYTNTNLMWNLSKMNCSAVNVYFVRDE